MKESEICDKLIEHATNLNFVNYNEYEGWDFVLVRGGVVIGVQAKINLNLHLLAQAALLNNVHFKVIVYQNGIKGKHTANDYEIISKRLKLIRIKLKADTNEPYLVDIYNRNQFFQVRHRPKKLLTIPDFRYENPAGVPSPRTVSKNNINLVKLGILADSQGGWITTAQSRAIGLTRVPKRYYWYDFKAKRWQKDDTHDACLDYKHIYLGIMGK